MIPINVSKTRQYSIRCHCAIGDYTQAKDWCSSAWADGFNFHVASEEWHKRDVPFSLSGLSAKAMIYTNNAMVVDHFTADKIHVYTRSRVHKLLIQCSGVAYLIANGFTTGEIFQLFDEDQLVHGHHPDVDQIYTAM